MTHVPVGNLEARRRASKPEPVPQELLDDPRVRALIDWHDRGQPDNEVDLGGAPELTEEQLAQMKKTRLRIARRR